MPEQYLEAIIKYLSDRDYQPLKMRQLARRMGVEDTDYDAFRDAVKQLKDDGRVVLGPKNMLSLPPIAEKVVGTYRGNPRGFGFVVPDEPNAHGDLFIPDGESSDAITGDSVVAQVFSRGKREGRTIYHGRIIEILERGNNRFVGELNLTETGVWFVAPQGSALTDPIVIDDVGPSGKSGHKVVVEIVRYPKGTDLAHGVIVESLGLSGPIDVETLAMIREHGLPDTFPEPALDDARLAIERFELEAAAIAAGKLDTREDLTGLTIVTIDPDDARDYDDAISIEARPDGRFRLGVHISDVSHFVQEGRPLDEEARTRGNSVYFPRKVVPMLPEILSNGVCSLQEGQVRFVKSAFMDYDSAGEVVGSRCANARIRSSKRLTYRQAQAILNGETGGYALPVVELVRQMQTLARLIEARRRAAGMLHLDLPEVELVFTPEGKVTDAVKADDSYTHTIIEMFMVEANEAVARVLDSQKVAFLRRIHPESVIEGDQHLNEFIRACGFKLPKKITRHDMQALIAAVRGRPESYAVNLALLKTFERAEYSPMSVGHFALASRHYCHFTSPIRRYPDLTVHRLLGAFLRGDLTPESTDVTELTRLGEHCSFTERRAAGAEDELRTLLVLQMLANHRGETFDGVVTGITAFGIFVQSMKYLIEGLVRLEDLGDDWWEPNPRAGVVVAQRSGRQIRMGDLVTVRIVSVDLARRKLNLLLESAGKRQPAKPGGKKSKKKASQSQQAPRRKQRRR